MYRVGLVIIIAMLIGCSSQPTQPAPVINKKIVYVSEWSATELFELARLKRQQDFKAQFNQPEKTEKAEGKPNKPIMLPKLQPHYLRQQQYQQMHAQVVDLVAELVESLKIRNIQTAVSIKKIQGDIRKNRHNQRAKKILTQYLETELHRQWNSSKDPNAAKLTLRATLATEKDLILLKLLNESNQPLAAQVLSDFFFYRYVDGIRMDYK